jgi:hypothetical protein
MPLALSVAVQVAAEAKVRCDAQLSHGVVFFLEPATPTADRLCALRSFALDPPHLRFQTTAAFSQLSVFAMERLCR